MAIKKVMVAGGGVLGSQIAFQVAFHDLPVVVYDISQEALQKTKEQMLKLKGPYQLDLGATEEAFDQAMQRLTFTKDLDTAIQNIDLVIESVPERVEVKRSFYQQLAKVAPAQAIFVSNSSTFVPSMFAKDTGRPDKFLNLHFANQIWIKNSAEVMSSPQTDPQIYQLIVDFARDIGMVPIELKKEFPGYILNSLLIPLLLAAMGLHVRDVASPQDIDKTWMIATGAPVGPFAIIDNVGLKTAYNIVAAQADQAGRANQQELRQIAAMIKEMIEKGRLGREVGHGFYDYPHPEYAQPDFLKA